MLMAWALSVYTSSSRPWNCNSIYFSTQRMPVGEQSARELFAAALFPDLWTAAHLHGGWDRNAVRCPEEQLFQTPDRLYARSEDVSSSSP